MIRLYARTATTFTTNEAVLSPVSCKVTEEANGMFELEMEVDKTVSISEGQIISAPVPRGQQAFRIYRVKKSLKTKKVYARHIFYDLAKNFLLDVRPTDKSCQNALNDILAGTETATSFTGLSNIADIHTAYYIRKNPIQAIMSEDNSILKTWGGCLIRDNYTVTINAAGLDRGYEVRLGKNLVGVTDDSDESGVKTRLYPTVTIDSVVYALPEEYVDSAYIANYETPIYYEVRIDLTDEQIALPMADIYTLMRNYCAALFSNDKIDLPVINYKVDFVELSKTEQYKSLAVLEALDLYDQVTVNVSELGIDVKAQLIKYTYDCLKQRYERVELGSFSQTAKYQTDNIIKQIQAVIVQNQTNLQLAVDRATELLTTALGGYVIKRAGEILIMDTEDPATATKVWRWNLNGLGYSSGPGAINGPYGIAMTMDGKIVATFIEASSLSAISANLGTVTSGLIQSTDGTVVINLDGATGLTIYDDTALVGSMTSEAGAVFPILQADDITGNVLNTIDTDITLIVGVGNPYPTITAALASLGSKKILNNANVTINVYGTISDNVNIGGFVGDGSLLVYLQNSATVNGSIKIRNNCCGVWIGSGGTGRGVVKRTDSSVASPIIIQNSAFVELYALDLNSNGGSYGVYHIGGGRSAIYSCDIVNSTFGILTNYGAIASSLNNRGNVTNYGIVADNGSVVFLNGTIPNGAIGGYNATTGHIITTGTITETDSAYSPPSATPTVFVGTFSPTSMYTVNHDTSSVDSYYGATAAQGKYTGMSYWKDGVMTFNGDIYNYWQGGYNVTVEMRVRRRSAAHGTSAGVVPTAYNFSPSEAFNAIACGVWSDWTTVPSSVFGSSGATLKFYNGTLNSGYAIFDACEVKVTVTKDV